MQLNHQAKVVTYKFNVGDAYKADGIDGPNDLKFSKRILCEGDSWFSIGAIPSSNLLFPLKFRQSTLLINLARPGDTIVRMSSIAQNPDLHQLIVQPNFSTRWDALFLSGGGNDLIDMADQIICTPSTGAGRHMFDYIDTIELERLKLIIQQGYLAIDKLRQGSDKNRDMPIVVHLYDYPTPRNAKASFLGVPFMGPWLYAAFKTNDVPQEFWISITDYLFEAMGRAIMAVSGQIENFHVISATRGVLTRARLGTTGEDGDWLNEIHPTAKGYEKLAAVVSPYLDSILNP